MKNIRRVLLLAAIGIVFTATASAITWSEQEFTCPIDNQKNTFMVVMSYGSYIYADPSKYQVLFFPMTASPTFYICSKCHLTTYMWDFDELPKNKLDAVRKVLETVTVSKAFKKYTELSVTERLEIMEKVYGVLDKENDWWEAFYRLKGYHYGKAGEAAKAAAARQKSLAILKTQLTDQKSETPRKLLLYLSGAMKHFLGDDPGALTDLTAVLKAKYTDKTATAEELKNGQKNLNERATNYITRIKSDKDKPRLSDTSTGDADDH